MITLQLAYHHRFHGTLTNRYKQLPEPASVDFYRALSLGSDRLMSYLLLLNVQLHDNQEGLHRKYTNINYTTLSHWLLSLYELNPHSDYPAFLATRVYSNVPDKARIRKMIDVVETLFQKNPQQHWRRMTEACLLAKHQLQDLNLALILAQKIHALPAEIKLPFWARDMKLVLLDELGQYESAQLLISSLLQGGDIEDPDERRFLEFRLLKIQQALLKNQQSKTEE
jgi:hypothetical protein